MLCPACNAENPNTISRCTSCGGTLKSKPRRRGLAAETDTPFAPRTEACNRAALRAYHICLLGLIPGVGLLCGPAAMVLGLIARHRGTKEPGFTADSPALAAILLGCAIALTNWLGFVMMVIGILA